MLELTGSILHGKYTKSTQKVNEKLKKILILSLMNVLYTEAEFYSASKSNTIFARNETNEQKAHQKNC